MRAIKLVLLAALGVIAAGSAASAQAVCENYGHDCHAEINGVTHHLERSI